MARPQFMLLLSLLLAASPVQGLSPLRRPYMASPPIIGGSGTDAMFRKGSSSSRSTTNTAEVAVPVPVVVCRDIPSWADLPSKPNFRNMDLSLRAEIWIGRLAMGGAIGLVATELGTGESFVNQFLDLLFAHGAGMP